MVAYAAGVANLVWAPRTHDAECCLDCDGSASGSGALVRYDGIMEFIRASQSILSSIFVAALGITGGACGGSTGGEPLVSGAVSGSYDGANFEMKYGFATKRNASYLIALGSKAIDCSTVNAPDPPAGDAAAIAVATLDVGEYANVQVQLYHNVTSFSGAGSNAGHLTIAQSATTVAGTIAYSDMISSKSYALNGTFEVMVCP